MYWLNSEPGMTKADQGQGTSQITSALHRNCELHVLKTKIITKILN